MPHNTMPESMPFASALAADYDNLNLDLGDKTTKNNND